MGEGSDVEGYRDLGPRRENQNNEKGKGNTAQPIEKTNESNGPTEMEVDRNIQKEGGVTTSISAVKGPGLSGSAGEEGVGTSPNGGRGDPASTMLWSPRKHAGQKRPLDTDVAVSDNETSDDEDEMSEGSQEGEATNKGEQPRPAGEPEHQVNRDRTGLNEETETLAASEGDRRGKATCTAVKRQSAKVAAVSARDDRIQEEGERFMGRKIKGVVSQPNGSPVEEAESPRAEQAREEGEPNSETSGEGQTNANREEEQPEAKEGGEEWSEREEEKKELEQVGRRELEQAGRRELETEVRRRAPGSATESEEREGAQPGQLAHPSPRRQVDSTNGLITLEDAGIKSNTRGQGELQEGGVNEGEKEGQSKKIPKAKDVDPPRKSRTARWSEEGTERQSYQEASIWEKQA
jgi:hypothetical protein